MKREIHVGIKKRIIISALTLSLFIPVSYVDHNNLAVNADETGSDEGVTLEISTDENVTGETTETESGLETESSENVNIKESNKVDNSKTDGKITKPIKKGIVFKDAKTAAVYKITKINKRKDEILGGNVTLIKTTNKKRKVVRVADIVKYEDCGFKVTAVGDNAFKNGKKLQKLIIGKNVKKIGKNAFRGCKKLKRIVFSGDNIKKIGKNAFKGISKKARYSASVRIYEKLLKLIKKSGKKK